MLSRLASSSVSWILGLATMTNSYHLLTSHTNIPFKAWLCPARLLVASHVQSLDLTLALKNKRQINFALYLLFFLHLFAWGTMSVPVHMWRPEDNFGKPFPPPTFWVSGVELQSSGPTTELSPWLLLFF